MDRCAKHPLKLVLPDPARGRRRSGHAATVLSYGCRIFHFGTRLHGCRGDPWNAAAPAQPSPGSKPFCLSDRSKQKLDAGSPGQLANRAEQATYVGAQPRRLIQINPSGGPNHSPDPSRGGGDDCAPQPSGQGILTLKPVGRRRYLPRPP